MKSLIAYAHETYSEEAAYHVFGGMPMRDVQALLLFYKPAFRRQTQLQALQETCIFFLFRFANLYLDFLGIITCLNVRLYQ